VQYSQVLTAVLHHCKKYLVTQMLLIANELTTPLNDKHIEKTLYGLMKCHCLLFKLYTYHNVI